MKSFPRMSAKRHLTKEGLSKITRKEARALLEHACPWMVKPKRLRSIVRRIVQKTRSKEFADKLDALLCATHTVHDLGQQLTAINPKLLEAQRDGSIERERGEALQKLEVAYEELLLLV
jgi:hypothetical protein